MSGQVGRPPVPIERKRKLGNPGKRPLPNKKDIPKNFFGGHSQ
jgi:hypothetical protein